MNYQKKVKPSDQPFVADGKDYHNDMEIPSFSTEEDKYFKYLINHHGANSSTLEHGAKIPEALSDDEVHRLFYLRRANARLRLRISEAKAKYDLLCNEQAPLNRFCL